MSYRPITDVWILARSKVKYHGAYPAGFLHRARALLGVGPTDAVLHVCAGRIRDYPYRGFGLNDRTVDLDPATTPDWCLDVRKGLPCQHGDITPCIHGASSYNIAGPCLWPGVLIDRPYTPDDAATYAPGRDALPDLNALLKAALELVSMGGRVGVLDYQWPHPGKIGHEVAVVAVGTGRNGRARWFTVFERVV